MFEMRDTPAVTPAGMMSLARNVKAYFAKAIPTMSSI